MTAVVDVLFSISRVSRSSIAAQIDSGKDAWYLSKVVRNVQVTRGVSGGSTSSSDSSFPFLFVALP